ESALRSAGPTAAGPAASPAGERSGRGRRSPPPSRSVATSRDRARRRSAHPANLRCRVRAGSTRRGRRAAGASRGAREGREATPARERGRARRWRRSRRSARAAGRGPGKRGGGEGGGQEVLVPDVAPGGGARHGDEARRGVEPDRLVAEGAKAPEIATGATAEIENRERAWPLEARPQRVHVLADVMVLRPLA